MQVVVQLLVGHTLTETRVEYKLVVDYTAGDCTLTLAPYTHNWRDILNGRLVIIEQIHSSEEPDLLVDGLSDKINCQ